MTDREAASVSSRDGEQKKNSFRHILTRTKYSAPSWAEQLSPVPTEICTLGHFPTPIHPWKVPGLPADVQLYIKRDDLTGMQLSGNKVRKLEFLLAEALQQGCDSVITIGGIQSNHCRATAVAARYWGLDSYLILRTSRTLVDQDPGLVGNLLVERLVGAHVELVSKEDYVRLGSMALGHALKQRLESEGRRPYLIPVGGSNALGSWGYVEAVRELEEQVAAGAAGGASGFDDIVVACGSGGTTAGLSLGSHLSSLKARVHSYGVCDNPQYFYEFTQGLLDDMGAQERSTEIALVHDAKGQGYALSSAEELAFVQRVAEGTGVILDPVYSGKALFRFMQDVAADPGAWAGRRVLFLHTGGLLGMYDKVSQLQPLVAKWSTMPVP